jgi:glutathione S-transferase
MLRLHHLETSRSSRIIWALEALGVEYELVPHKRGPDMRAGAELAAIHPLGKAPIIVDGDMVLAESSSILRYIANRYGNGRLVPLPGSDEYARHDEWLDYAESSLMLPLMFSIIGRMTGGLSPAMDGFTKGELGKSLDYIGNAVSAGPFIMGAKLTLADIQMSYCMAVLESGGLLAGRPALTAYWENLQADPGFKRSIEIGGPLVLSRK